MKKCYDKGTEDPYFSWKQPLKCLNDGFVSYKLFSSQDVNCWSGVDYCDNQLTLILTAPIHCRGSIGEQCNTKCIQICFDEETNSYILDDPKVSFQ